MLKKKKFSGFFGGTNLNTFYYTCLVNFMSTDKITNQIRVNDDIFKKCNTFFLTFLLIIILKLK